jgi:hypothetical protein
MSTERHQSVNTASSQLQKSVNDFGCCSLNNPSTMQRRIPRHKILAAVMSKRDRNMVTAPVCISNEPCFRQEHWVVSNGPDGSEGTSYPLTENQTRRVRCIPPMLRLLFKASYFRCVVYYARRPGVSLPLLSVRNVVTYTHHQNDTYVTLFVPPTL